MTQTIEKNFHQLPLYNKAYKKKMKMRKTNTSTDNNIRFIITDIEKFTSEEVSFITTPPPHHATSSKKYREGV